MVSSFLVNLLIITYLLLFSFLFSGDERERGGGTFGGLFRAGNDDHEMQKEAVE